MNYFAIIEEGFASRFAAIPDDELPFFKTVAQQTKKITEAEYLALSSYREGRIEYRLGKFEHRPDGPEVHWANVRAQRDAKLAATDWRVVSGVEQGQPMPQAWKAYRQALRDITKQADPKAIVWPVEPAG
jgi:hypothetical protein